MRIALLFAPYRHRAFEENLTVVDDDFGLFPPISLAYLAAALRAAGHQVRLVDGQALRLDPAQAASALRDFAPQLLGTYLSTYMIDSTLAWMTPIKEQLGAPLVVGGSNLALYPRETMTHPVIDYAIAGEGIVALPALAATLDGGGDLDAVPGLLRRVGGGDRDGEVVANPPAELVSFDDYPMPARDLLPNERYVSFLSQRRNFTLALTALGCPWNCSFCAIAPVPYRTRDPESCVEELARDHCDHGIREVDVFDADFTADRDRAAAFARALIDRRLDLEWSCRSRVDALGEELLSLLAASGCRQIYVGIETPDPAALRRMNKPLRIEGVPATLRRCRRAGIRPLGFFMTAVPGETRASLARTIRYACSLPLDYAQFSRTIAKPGSALHRQQVETTGSDFWRDWVLGQVAERRMGSPWTALSEGEIELWTKLAYYGFYFRPRQLAAHLRQIRSPDELRRQARTALRMLNSVTRRDPAR